MNKAQIPIYMIVGKHDVLVAPELSRKTRSIIEERLIDYDEVNGGHNVFMIAKDVSSWAPKLIEHLDK